ncbi:hypothetical protein ACFE04_012243 [Oxalis oulophora]
MVGSHLYEREAAIRVAKHQATISKLEEDGAVVEDERRRAVVERGLAVSKLEEKELRVIELEADLQIAHEALEKTQKKKDLAEEHMDEGELTEPGEQAEKEAAELEENTAMEVALNAAYKAILPSEGGKMLSTVLAYWWCRAGAGTVRESAHGHYGGRTERG